MAVCHAPTVCHDQNGRVPRPCATSSLQELRGETYDTPTSNAGAALALVAKRAGPARLSRHCGVFPQVQGVVAMSGNFCSGGVQAYTIRATFALMAPLRSFVEGVPHGRYYS